MAPQSDSMRVIGYLSGPLHLAREVARQAGAPAPAAYRADGVTYTSTNPLQQLSVDVLYTEFAEEDEAARLIPVTNEVSSGAETFAYVQVTDVGQARPIIGHVKDVPQVDVEVELFTAPIVKNGCYYTWTIHEQDAVQLAQAQGYPIDLPAEKARAANKANARAASELGLVGIPALSISGLFNEPTIDSAALPTGDWTNASTSQAEILADVDAVVSAVFTNTLQRHRANVLLVGSVAYGVLRSTYRGDGTDQTLLAAIESAYAADNLKVETSAWLDRSDVGSGGSILAYKRDPDILRQEVPILYREQPPQMSGYSVEVFTDSSATGCIIRRPAAVVMGTGAIV
jgi:hypothetical protein